MSENKPNIVAKDIDQFKKAQDILNSIPKHLSESVQSAEFKFFADDVLWCKMYNIYKDLDIQVPLSLIRKVVFKNGVLMFVFKDYVLEFPRKDQKDVSIFYYDENEVK